MAGPWVRTVLMVGIRLVVTDVGRGRVRRMRLLRWWRLGMKMGEGSSGLLGRDLVRAVIVVAILVWVWGSWGVWPMMGMTWVGGMLRLRSLVSECISERMFPMLGRLYMRMVLVRVAAVWVRRPWLLMLVDLYRLLFLRLVLMLVMMIWNVCCILLSDVFRVWGCSVV